MSLENGLVIKHGSVPGQNYNAIGLNQHRVNIFMAQHADLRAEGWQTVEVQSGSVVEGRAYLRSLGVALDTLNTEQIAMAGTAGQMHLWQRAGVAKNMPVFQILATHHQIDDKAEGRNIVRNIEQITELGHLCVINESDVAGTEEILAFEEGEDIGLDNDWMAAHVAIAIGARTLLLLGKKPGLEIAGAVATEIRTADVPEILQYCHGTGDGGTGGMGSKIQAAGRAAANNIEVIIGSAFEDPRGLIAGDVVCTRVVK